MSLSLGDNRQLHGKS